MAASPGCRSVRQPLHGGSLLSAAMANLVELSRSSVVGRLGALKSRGAGEDDPRVRECREDLELIAARDSLERAFAALPGPVFDRMLAELRAQVVTP